MYIKYFGAFSNPGCHSFTCEITVCMSVYLNDQALKGKQNTTTKTQQPLVTMYPYYCSFVMFQSFWVSCIPVKSEGGRGAARET